MALIDVSDGIRREMTYGELWRLSRRVENALIGYGVMRGDRVGVLLSQSFLCAAAHIAAWRIGAISVPLFKLFRRDALEVRLNDSGAGVVVSDDEGAAMLRGMAEKVEIFEVGPRDGLQNESRPIPAAEKIALVDCLSKAGFRRVEVASFVSPKWVPQMADSGEVLAGITRAPGVRYAALTPNLKGLERAIAARADEVAIFGSASEGFSRANINVGIAESLERFAPVAEAAQKAGLPVRGYISCACASCST